MPSYSRSLVTYKPERTCVRIKRQPRRSEQAKVSLQPVGKVAPAGSGLALSKGRAERSRGVPKPGLLTLDSKGERCPGTGAPRGSDLCRELGFSSKPW